MSATERVAGPHPEGDWTEVDGCAWYHPGAGEPGEARCLCGSLLARLVPNGLELKCRRCKRQVVIPVAREVRVSNA